MTLASHRTDRIFRRRAGRISTVAAGTFGSLLVWAVNGPWADRGITVDQGDGTQLIGPGAVVGAALGAGLAAWALLALLERTTRRPAAVFRIVASIVLLLSLAGPLSSGADTGSRLALLGLHLTIGAALIIGLPGRRRC